MQPMAYLPTRGKTNRLPLHRSRNGTGRVTDHRGSPLRLWGRPGSRGVLLRRHTAFDVEKRRGDVSSLRDVEAAYSGTGQRDVLRPQDKGDGRLDSMQEYTPSALCEIKCIPHASPMHSVPQSLICQALKRIICIITCASKVHNCMHRYLYLCTGSINRSSFPAAAAAAAVHAVRRWNLLVDSTVGAMATELARRGW